MKGMQVQKVIEELGYTAKEAKVYLIALSLGEAHISDIAAKANMPRSSVQAVVTKLHKDGLMNFYVQRRYKYWVAEQPERLLAIYKKREDTMREALPKLNAIRRARIGKGRRREIDSRSFDMLRMLADSSAQPVLIVDERITIVYANSSWEEQFGYSLDEVAGENPRMLQSGKTSRDVYARMWESLKVGKLFQSDEVIDKRKDGTCFNLLTTIIPIAHGGKQFYIQILDDITEKKRAQELGKKFAQAIKR